MKSKITIDFRGVEAISGSPQQFEPVIKVDFQDSDDVRDKLIKEFFQSLGYSSSWLKVNFAYYGNDADNLKFAVITPVTPNELRGTIEAMKEVAENVKEK